MNVNYIKVLLRDVRQAEGLSLLVIMPLVAASKARQVFSAVKNVADAAYIKAQLRNVVQAGGLFPPVIMPSALVTHQFPAN